MIANVIIGNIFAALNVVINSCELIFVSRKMNFIKTIFE